MPLQLNENNISKKAGRAGLWYTVGNMLLKGCAFLTLPVFTRILTTGDFGIYNTYIAYEGLLSAILGLGLYGTIKNAKIDYGLDFDKYISAILSLALVFFAFIFAFVNIFFSAYNKFWIFNRFTTNCLLFQSFGTFLIHFYGVKLNTEFNYKSFLLISVFNTVGGVILSIFLILFVFPQERYYGRIFGSSIPPVLIALFVIFFILKRGREFYKKEYWIYGLAIGLPLIPHVISQSLLSQFDRTMINSMVGASEAGIYSYIYTICTIMAVICTSFDNAWTPWLFLKVNAGKENEVKEASKNYIVFYSMLTMGFMCVMPEISKLIADKSYWSGIDLIVPITLANHFIFLYFLPVSIEYYHKKTIFISVGTVCAALVNLVLNYIFIRLLGYKAAAYTTMISYAVLFLAHYLISKSMGFNEIFDKKQIKKITFTVIITGIIILCTSKIYILNVIIRIIISITILLLLWKKRKLVLSVIRRNQ